MSGVPQILIDLVQKWRSILLLDEWRITIELDDEVHDNPYGEVLATVEILSDGLQAHIRVQESTLESPTLERTIIHEMLHIRLHAVSEPALSPIFDEVHVGARELARSVLVSGVERSVAALTAILDRLKPSDEEDCE